MSETTPEHPGIVFKRAIEETVFNRNQVSKILDIHPCTLTSLLAGKRPLTYGMAERFSKFFKEFDCFPEGYKNEEYWVYINNSYYENSGVKK